MFFFCVCISRCFLGQGTGPAQHPDCNRYMELLIIRLCSAFPTPVKTKGKRSEDRFTVISRAYKDIREKVLGNAKVMAETRIVLFELNKLTITQWYNKRVKAQERQMLEQSIRLPLPPMQSAQALPEVRVPATHTVPVPPDQQHEFHLPPVTKGTARKRLFSPPAESPANPDSTCPRVLIPIRPKPGTDSLPESDPQSPAEAKSSTPTLARTTAWYRKKVDKKKEAGEYVRQYTRTPKPTYSCHRCGELRTSEKHHQYYGQWYCATTMTESLEEWRSSREKSRMEKKRKKQEEEHQS